MPLSRRALCNRVQVTSTRRIHNIKPPLSRVPPARALRYGNQPWKGSVCFLIVIDPTHLSVYLYVAVDNSCADAYLSIFIQVPDAQQFSVIIAFWDRSVESVDRPTIQTSFDGGADLAQ